MRLDKLIFNLYLYGYLYMQTTIHIDCRLKYLIAYPSYRGLNTSTRTSFSAWYLHALAYFLITLSSLKSKKLLNDYSNILPCLLTGIGNCLAPMFLSEISPFNIRGALGTVHQLSVTIGIFMSSVFGLPSILGKSGLWGYSTVSAAEAAVAVA